MGGEASLLRVEGGETGGGPAPEGVDGEVLAAALLEGGEHLLVRFGWTWGRVVVVGIGGLTADDVEVVAVAAPAHGRVAHLAIEGVGAEHEGPLDGGALRLVHRDGVGVGDVSCVDIPGRQGDGGTLVGSQGEGAGVGVEAGDPPTGAVEDSEAVGVLAAHDLVAALVGAVVDDELGAVELAGPDHAGPGAGIEVVDVGPP